MKTEYLGKKIYEDIDFLLLDYIKKPCTDYALFIDGVWGSGKTFYFTHEYQHAIAPVLA